MIHYDELPEEISETELEADVKQVLLDSFDEYALDDKSWDEDERVELAVFMLEEHLNHGVEVTDPLVQRVARELGDRMETARSMYRYYLAKLKLEI